MKNGINRILTRKMSKEVLLTAFKSTVRPLQSITRIIRSIDHSI